MKEWNSFDKIIKAKGMWLIDSKGNKMLDGVASMWCNVWGHSNPELVNAITNQSKKLQHSSMFNLTNEPTERLAENIVKTSPGMHKVFFSDNGSTAMEIAIKLALQYWKNIGHKKKTKIATRRFAKNQRTWLHRFRDVRWIAVSHDQPTHLLDEAIKIVNAEK